MANSQDTSSSRHPDLLAAVVLHTLVSEARDGMSAAAVAVACERDPDDPADLDEIEAALALLLDDGLAQRGAVDASDDAAQSKDEDDLYQPTRAAIRAAELSF